MQLILRGTKGCFIMVSVTDDAGQGEHWLSQLIILLLPSSSPLFIIIIILLLLLHLVFIICCVHDSLPFIMASLVSPFLDIFIVVHYLLVKKWFSLVYKTKKATQSLLTCLSVVISLGSENNFLLLSSVPPSRLKRIHSREWGGSRL